MGLSSVQYQDCMVKVVFPTPGGVERGIPINEEYENSFEEGTGIQSVESFDIFNDSKAGIFIFPKASCGSWRVFPTERSDDSKMTFAALTPGRLSPEAVPPMAPG
jgi:hypothetical protein